MEAGGEGLDEEEGVVWWCVMIVEYRNAFNNKLAHDHFCTAMLVQVRSLSRVRLVRG